MTWPPWADPAKPDAPSVVAEPSPGPFLKDRFGSRPHFEPRLAKRTGAAAGTWNRLVAMHGNLMEWLAKELEIHPAAALAVLMVESSGKGFTFDIRRRPRMVIRFEVHQFLGHCSPAARAAGWFRHSTRKKWEGHKYRQPLAGPVGETPAWAWKAVHQSQATEWEALEQAQALDPGAALKAISMGLPQIMGFNHSVVGYGTATEMFEAFKGSGGGEEVVERGERVQICGLFDFILSQGLAGFLRGGNWLPFAERYNGKGQALVYAEKLRAAFAQAWGALGA